MQNNYKFKNPFFIMTKSSLSLIQFIVGIVLAIFGAVLMFFGIFPVSIRIIIGILGLSLIATSKFKLLK